MQYQASDLTIFKQAIKERFKNEEDVKVIFDIGSCHALESVEFTKIYSNAKVVAFEANPVSYKVCLDNTENHPAISVVNVAVNEYDGTCKFYPMDKDKTITTWEDGNQGASSLYRANGAYDYIEKYVQYEIEVPCTRLDTYCQQHSIDRVDVIWMDLQGAELKALKSLGKLLETVKIIHTELEINPIYEGQCLFVDVYQYLIDNDFSLVWGNTDATFGTDFIFIKN
jgi:FkbM family methyltransferase